ETGDAVEHAFRQTGALEKLRHENAGPGRESRGLEDDGVAREQRRQRLAAHDVHREVPWTDNADNAERLVLNVCLNVAECARRSDVACECDDLIEMVAAFDKRR